MPKPLRYAERLARMPPVFCRLCAVVRGRLLTDAEIAAASSLPLAEVKRVGYSVSWDAIPTATHQSFLKGCGLDLERRRCWRRLEYMRRRGHFRHLRRSPLWDAQFAEMVDLLP